MADVQKRSHETADIRQEDRHVFITLCRPEIDNAQNAALMRDLLANLHSLDQVVVGLIDGYCLGGGVQLAAACDIRVATTRAVFAIQASREVGILGGMATWYLPRLLGIGRAKALLLGGAVLNAARAADWGLIDQVVQVGGLPAAWEQIIAPLSADSLASIAACKHIIETAHDVDFETAFAHYLRTQDRLMALPAAANIAQATIERLAAGKRPYLEVGWLPFGNPDEAKTTGAGFAPKK
jgi:enoyl-CoA hydratase/carnithine racemase